ncbi:4Fe-4S binding protein [Sulfurisphaera ohwakuensis]|uniref:4Fe-4S binding protein n=1 Tax=Sulfurisphaera ohwakuensis TaxID=69656 RepID=UPI0036F2A17E
MNIGLVVSQKARELLTDNFLLKIYKESGIPYVAEFGDYLANDVRDNELQGLLIVSELEMSKFVAEADERLGLNPLAIEVLPLSWFSEKSENYRFALLMAYIRKLSRQELVYRLQPIKNVAISRRSLIRFKLYEYRPYPVLFDSIFAEREINTLISSCPKGILAKTIEGVGVTSPENCSYCGYCTTKGYLGYLEMPTFTTDQLIYFINTINYYDEKAKVVVFTKFKDIPLQEGYYPLLIPSLASVPDVFLYVTYASGLVPVLLIDNEISDIEKKRLDEIPAYFPGSKLPIYKVKAEELQKLELKNELRKSLIPEELPLRKYRRRNLYLWAIDEMRNKIKLDEEAEVPGIYFVSVDPEKCVLCGVCVRACQMMVPDLRNINDIMSLEYNIPMCIGSQRCAKNCPENAIKVERFAKIKELKKITVNKAVVAKCRYCGKPIGSVKVKNKVDSLLIGMGFSGTAQYTDVCNECKQKMLTKVWLENYLKLKGGK